MVGKVLAQYQISEKLGEGGMGVVWKALDTHLDRFVALKTLSPERLADPERKRRFVQEAKAASALNHPNIVHIYDIADADGVQFIAMEYVAGKTLDQLIGRKGLRLNEALKCATQIADALAKAHSAGIIHRDLKPSNIMLTENGLVKVLDFGLAKLAQTATGEFGDTATLTAPEGPNTEEGTIVGTIAYMSPEQAEGKKVDARSDIFSFGSVLYEMFTGRRAFQGDTKLSILSAILKDDPKPVSTITPDVLRDLEKIISHCLRKDPDRRFQHMDDLKVALLDLKEESESGKHSAATATGATDGRKSWLRGVLAGTVVLLLAAGAFVWFSGRAPSPHDIKQWQLTANSTENPLAAGGAISPDGKYLAYVDRQGIHVKLLDTDEVRTIRPMETLIGTWLSWFPDSARLLATVNQPEPSIWVLSILGGAPRKLPSNASGWGASVSPGGSLIAFTADRGRLKQREIWLMDADGANPRKLLEGDDGTVFENLRWSADGVRIAYTRSHYLLDNKHEVTIETRDLKGGRPARVYSEVYRPPETRRLKEFVWAGDRRMILILGEPGSRGISSLSSIENLWEVPVDRHTGQPAGKVTRFTDWPSGSQIDSLSMTADGKRLAFRRVAGQSGAYVAELAAGGKQITKARRLTLNQGWNHPAGWTVDSRMVVIESNRNGPLGIFKQALNEDTAEAIIAGPEDAWSPCVSPDGASILYLAYPTRKGFAGSSVAAQLVRASITGGPPQVLFTAHFYDRPRCARSPATLCAIAEPDHDRKHIIFTALDPEKGRGPELIRLPIDPEAEYIWDLSPDGTRIALLEMFDRRAVAGLDSVFKGPIHVLSLRNKAPQKIFVKGWDSFGQYIDWAADGKSLFLPSFRQGISPLLNVDMRGNASVLWEESTDGASRGVPSPDGRRLAILSRSRTGNMWMVGNF